MATPDLRLPSQPQDITASWLVPNLVTEAGTCAWTTCPRLLAYLKVQQWKPRESKKFTPPQAFPAAIYTKKLTIFKFYTPFVYAYIYAKLQNFIQLSLTSTKLCGPVFKKLVLEIQYGGPPTRYRYPAHTISTYLKPIHTAITPGTTKLSCLCRVRFGSVNWIPDNSGLSPTESLKSKQVNSNCPIHTATPDTTETGLFCCVWRVGGVNWALVGVV